MRSIFIGGLCALIIAAAFDGPAAAQKSAGTKTTAGGVAARRRAMDPAKDKFGLSRIGQIAVPVKDLERATAFYRDKLGMKYLFTANGMAFFDLDGVRLMLSRLEEAGPGQTGSIIYFRVDDIQEGYKILTGRGVRFEERPELAAKTEKFELWLACLKDTENNNLCLMSETPTK